MILMLVSYTRFGTLSMINLAFGLLMVIFSPWMTLAIIISGVLADFTLLLPLATKTIPVVNSSIVAEPSQLYGISLLYWSIIHQPQLYLALT
jgi:hypothetical protein